MTGIAGESTPEFENKLDGSDQDPAGPNISPNEDPQSLVDKSFPAKNTDIITSTKQDAILKNEASSPEQNKADKNPETEKTRISIKDMLVAGYQILKVAYEGSIKFVAARTCLIIPHAALGTIVGGLTGVLIDAISKKPDAFISDPKTALWAFLGGTVICGLLAKANQIANQKFEIIKTQKIDNFMRKGLSLQQPDVLMSKSFQEKVGGVRGEIWRVYQFADKPMEVLSNTVMLTASVCMVGYLGSEALLPVVVGGFAKAVSAWFDLVDFERVHKRLKNTHHVSSAVCYQFLLQTPLIEMVISRKHNKVAEVGAKAQSKILAEKDQLFLRSAKRGLVAEIFNYGSLGAALFTCIKQVQAGTMSSGELAAVITAISQFSGATTGLIESSIGQLNNISIVKEFLEVCRAPKPIKRSDELNARIKRDLVDCSGAPNIIFDNVSFEYPEDKNKNNIVVSDDDKNNQQPEEKPFKMQNISFSLSPGKVIGLAGTNGSGKSTVINILLGFNKPKGEVKINGIDLQSLDVRSEWLSRVGILTQDHYLFTGLSIGDQIVSELLEDPEEQKRSFGIEEVANVIAFSGQLRMRIKEKYLIGEGFNHGFKPSGGQMQKIAFARALALRPDVLILDEPTASLDASAAKDLLPNLRQFCEANDYHPTILVVTHKMDIFPLCDQVIVMNNGEVKGQGSHQELIGDKESVYYKLYNDFKS